LTEISKTDLHLAPYTEMTKHIRYTAIMYNVREK